MTESCSGECESERIVGIESVLETEYLEQQQWVVGMLPELVVIVAAVGTGCGGLMLRLLLLLLLRRKKVRCVEEARFARERRV